MRKKKLPALAFVLIATYCGLPQRIATADTATVEIAAAAEKFLGTLDDAQRGKVQFEFNDEQQRKRWSNLPTGAFQRAGLRMGDLTQPQRDAAMAVVESGAQPGRL